MDIDRFHISRRLKFRWWAPIFAGLLFSLAMIWAGNGDPFKRVTFSLKTAGSGKTECIAILPKPVGKHPVVIYIHGAGEGLLSIGTTLRQIAERGVAVVGIEYNQTNQAAFDEQFLALHNYLQQQPWVENNATAWVGASLGAQQTLRFILNHPDIQPQLLVRLSGGWVLGLDSFTNQPNKLPIHCPVLLVNGEKDEVFPIGDVKRLADLLHAAGTSVDLQILPDTGHDFGVDQGVVLRVMAEYCRAHLPLTDYTAALSGCRLNQAERRRFNVAMQRAGQNRRALWKAVSSTHEPERRTVMMVIGGLEDYDLAHMTASHLKEVIHIAWQARRNYPWCRDTPLDIFEKFTANPRFYEEPIDRFQPVFSRRLHRIVKYCRTTEEASNAVWKWMHQLMVWDEQHGLPGKGKTPEEIFEAGASDCEGMAVLYTALCRSVGLPERTTMLIWQNSLGTHYCTEVWSVEEKRWRELDSTAETRAYNANWTLRVPKAMILTPTGERGVWNATAENRLDAFINTIDLVYPSAMVLVKVLDHGTPVVHQPVGIELPSVKGLVLITRSRTDDNGEMSVVLGESAKYPYRFFIDQPGETDWQWLEVHPNQTCNVVLNLEKKRPFDPEMSPPALVYTNLLIQ
jgi:pimeloyl-ACP methyl ester carboxylesterase